MDVNLMQLFVSIVEGGNLSAAARNLNMTRSNVSRRLRALERQVGVRLLRRTTHEVSLTAAGELVFTRARNIVRELAAVQAELGNKGGGLHGAVRVCAPNSLVHHVLTDVFTDFSRDYPSIALDVVHSHQVRDLHAEHIDVAVHIARHPIETAVVAWRSEVEWVICAAPAYLKRYGAPRSPQELATRPMICYARREGLIPLSASIGNHRESLLVNARIRTNDLQFTRDATCAGNGIGVIARYAAKQAIDDGHLVELFPNYSFRFNSARLFVQTMESGYQTSSARTMTLRIRERLQSLELIRAAPTEKSAA